MRSERLERVEERGGDDLPEADRLSAALRDLEKRYQTLKEQHTRLRAEKEHLEALNLDLCESISWRITAPLRIAKRLSREIFPLFRSGVWAYEPALQGGAETGTANVAVELRGDRDGAPTGWCELSLALDASQSHTTVFLHVDDGAGFTSKYRTVLTAQTGVLLRELVRLPQGTKHLRFDPFDARSVWQVRQCRVRELGSAQLAFRFFKKHVVRELSNPMRFVRRVRKAWALFRSGGLVALRVKLFSDDISANYQEWVKRFDTLSDDDRSLIRARCAAFPSKPLISVLMPVFNPPAEYLRAAIESVRKQLYEHWELCIVDDCSTDSSTAAVLEEYRNVDPRIRITRLSENKHIAGSSQVALQEARGEFVALLDHDDELSEHALYCMVEELHRSPDANLIYSDEDKITGHGVRFNPYFKSDWNPVLLLSQNYVCHLGLYRTTVLKEVGGFRPGTDGAQDWDVTLRVSEVSEPGQIVHLPRVLYHWRVIEGSTAQSVSFKPYVREAQARVVREHLERTGRGASRVEFVDSIAQIQVTFPVPTPSPLVSIIIPTRDNVGVLKTCIDSILHRTNYKNFEILIVDNGSSDRDALEYLESVQHDARVRVLRDDGAFNFSRINNDAVKSARGSLLGFLNNDLEVITPEWLDQMVSYAVQPGVGAVGAQLWYPNDLLQHGGIVLGIGGVAGHSHKGRRRGDPGYFNCIILPHCVSAVTAACMIMPRAVFDELGGFDPDRFAVAFNDVDLCLRIRAAGYQIVYNPYASLYHYESASRGYEDTPEKFLRFEGEIEAMRRKWAAQLDNDPFYNPNLTLLTEDYAFAFPPRGRKPWISA